MATAASAPTTPLLASEATNSTAATLECAAQAMIAASSRFGSICAAISARPWRRVGEASTGAMLSTIRCSASSMRPRPMDTRPRSRVRLRVPRRKATTPTSTRGGKTTVMSKASACTISAVPTLAPSMAASAGASATAPEAAKEETISAVAVLLCSAAVTPSPASTARTWPPRAMPSQRCSRLPKARCTPDCTMCRPQSSSAASPASSSSSRASCMAGRPPFRAPARQRRMAGGCRAADHATRFRAAASCAVGNAGAAAVAPLPRHPYTPGFARRTGPPGRRQPFR